MEYQYWMGRILMLQNPNSINVTDFINGSATANGTVLTVAANKYFSVNIQLGATATIAATNTAKVTLTNASTAGTFSPPNNSVVSHVTAVGLLAAATSVS